MKRKVDIPRGWYWHMAFSPCIGTVSEIRLHFPVQLAVQSRKVKKCVGWLHTSKNAVAV